MACSKILSPEVNSRTANLGSLGCRMDRDNSGDSLASDRGRLTENILSIKEGRGLALEGEERASVARLPGFWLYTGDGGRLQEQTNGRPSRCHLPLCAVCPGPQFSLLGGQGWLIHLCGVDAPPPELCVQVLERELHQNRVEDLGSEPQLLYSAFYSAKGHGKLYFQLVEEGSTLSQAPSSPHSQRKQWWRFFA